MTNANVALLAQEARTIYGLWTGSNDKTAAKDIPALSGSFHAASGTQSGAVLPFYVLSRGYDEATRDFELFVGGETPHPALEALELPAGEYARITVKPKLGFAWGLAIGEAKRYFYTQWLPASRFRARNMEYELHTARSAGKSPTLDILFALEEK